MVILAVPSVQDDEENKPGANAGLESSRPRGDGVLVNLLVLAGRGVPSKILRHALLLHRLVVMRPIEPG